MLTELKTGDKVCRLRKSIYGLRQAGQSWYNKMDEVLRKFGLKPSYGDPCVYFSGQGEEIFMIIVYVDEILVITKDLNKISEFKVFLSQ